MTRLQPRIRLRILLPRSQLASKSARQKQPQTQSFQWLAPPSPVLLLLIAFAILFASQTQARSSVGERFLDTEEVGGSIPPVPIGFGIMKQQKITCPFPRKASTC